MIGEATAWRASLRSIFAGDGLMWRWRFAPLSLVLGAVVIPSAPGLAAEPSGTAVAVLQSAEAVGSASGRRVLAVQAPVFMGDRIITGPAGEAQLRFRDETRLVVGANAQLVVDAFVFNSQTSAKNVSIDAVRGAFRFITGGSPKQAYSIHTPTATIGVQGTQFDFSVAGNGQTSFVLYEGSAKLCDLSGHCIVLSGGCSVAVLAPHRSARRLTSVSDRAVVLGSAFPYLRSQSRLRRDFRVDTSGCNVQRAELTPGGGVAFSRATFAPGLPGPASPGPGPGPGPAPGPAPGPSADSGGHCEGNCGNGQGNGEGTVGGGGGNGNGNNGKGGGSGNHGK
jgi:uncharacterized membrane protein YgcG